MNDLEPLVLALHAAIDQQTADLRAELARSRDAVALQGAEVVPITPAAAGASNEHVLSGASGVLMGYGLRETTGTATATLELRDGQGALICPVTLAANESARDWFGPGGLSFVNGLQLVRVAGSADGAVYLGGVG